MGTSKTAFYVSYLGTSFHGFQRQPTLPTVEGELDRALHEAGAISRGDVGTAKIQWARAGRTDKGVSAAANVVSCVLRKDSWEGLLERVNAHLPPEVRVLGVQDVAASFDARRSCTCRQYEYLLPLWALDPQVGMSRAAKAAAVAAAAATDNTDSAQADADGAAAGHDVAGGFRAAAADDRGAEAMQGTEVREVRDPAAQASEGAGPSDKDAAAAEQDRASGKGGGKRKGSWWRDKKGKKRGRQPGVGAGQQEGQTWVPGEAALKATVRAGQEAQASRFVLDDSRLALLNGILARFEGSHSFHNFTSEPVVPGSLDATRTVHRFSCDGVIEVMRQLPQHPGQAAHPSPGAAADAAVPASMDPPDLRGLDAKGSGDVWQPSTAKTGEHGRDGALASAGGDVAAAETGPLGGEAAGSQQSQQQQQHRPQRYAKLVVRGTSFMMYQIRKMVGLALAVARGAASAECITTALQPGNAAVTVPMAPSTGLLMDRAEYEQYNEEQGPDGHLRVGEAADVLAAAESFKREVVYRAIAAADPAEAWLFLKGLTEPAFGFSKWLPTSQHEPGPAAVESSGANKRARTGC